MQCEMCGATGQLFKTDIEGAEMKLCQKCAKFGKVISAVKAPLKAKQLAKQEKESADEKLVIIQRTKPEVTQELKEDYSNMISKKRQELDLKQKDLAIKMAEKESLIQKVEAGQFRPSIELAKKFERALGIKIIEEHIEEHKAAFRAKKDPVTIGDFILIKKAKKD